MLKKLNPVAKVLRTPRYKPQVIPNKKNKHPRKGKHRKTMPQQD
jgi:hypothetical protein